MSGEAILDQAQRLDHHRHPASRYETVGENWLSAAGLDGPVCIGCLRKIPNYQLRRFAPVRPSEKDLGATTQLPVHRAKPVARAQAATNVQGARLVTPQAGEKFEFNVPFENSA